jgi:hypothetical protein
VLGLQFVIISICMVLFDFVPQVQNHFCLHISMVQHSFKNENHKKKTMINNCMQQEEGITEIKGKASFSKIKQHLNNKCWWCLAEKLK